MALSGSFSKYPISGTKLALICNWSATQNQAGNYSDVKLDVYLQYYHIDVGSRADSIISINGTKETYTTAALSSSTNSWKTTLLKSKTVRVKHNSDGTKKGVQLSASWSFNGYWEGRYVGTISASASVDLDAIKTYKLSVQAGTGSSITVSRTSSSYGGVENLSNGATLYYGDKLKITFSAGSNYAINTHTVNGTAFTSGSTHTVTGNVSVLSTASVLASRVGATDAYIMSASSVTITKYNSSYYCSLEYKFGNLSGFVTREGGTSSSEVKFADTNISFYIPYSFYDQIPNSQSGKCTIICRTYSGANSTAQVGTATSCEITVYVSGGVSVVGKVTDVNATTKLLTGDENVLVKHLSTARATFDGVATTIGASVSARTINGTDIGVNGNSYVDYKNCDLTSFTFRATDSRGFGGSKTITPTVINYIPLTVNPVLQRESSTGSTIYLSVTGNYFNGSFGKNSNTLTIKYRYKEAGEETYSSWETINSAYLSTYSGGYSVSSIALSETFDYKKQFDFQIRARDGLSDTVLTTVTKDVTVAGGFPVFDWGKSDFRFNVPIYVSDGGNMANYWNPTNGIVATEVTAGKFAIGDKNSKYYLPYIVNSGTSGNWTYRKWSNGVAECWGKVSFTVSFQSSNGIYYDSENGRATFPFTFKSIPVVSGSTDWHYANWLNIWPSTTNYSRCGWIYFQTTENGNNTERSVYLYAIGQADANSISVVMSKNTLSLTTGESSTITASISPTGTAYNTVLWASSDNAVATVSNGKITAKSPGNAIIEAYTEDKAYKGECVVVVEPVTVSVTKITLDKSAITIEVGKTATLSATILPTDATNKKITWSSSSISIATVDNGVITAVKAGTATITAKTADGNYTASCSVTVTVAVTVCP